MQDAITLPNLSCAETYEIIPPRTILLGYVGSISHGTYIPKDDPNSIDDRDILGACLGPVESYLGLQKFEQKERFIGEWDSVVYDVRKLVHLLLKQNPNVLGLLWLKREDYVHIHELGQRLLDARDLFISKQAYHSFVGYAHGQLYKMDHGAFEGYMGEKRKRLVEQFGYDTKNAAHLIRLLRMGIEYLTDGVLRVFREDAKELKEIKRGGWPLEKVKAEADRLFVLAQEAYVRSPLPKSANTVEAEKLLIGIVRDGLRL